MQFLSSYIRRMGLRRAAFVLLGNVIAGLGIGLLRRSGLGFDPFCAMNLEVSRFVPLDYGTFQMLLNLALFAIQLAAGRHTIGFGTIINACLLGYINAFFLAVLQVILPEALLTAPVRLLLAAAAAVTLSFGLSLYQTPAAGTAPYDALPFLLNRRFPGVSYFWWRMLLDVSCALICLLAGGLASGDLGIGTVICAFCLGPVIHFFDRAFTRKHVTPM